MAGGFILDKRRVAIIIMALQELEKEMETNMCHIAYVSGARQENDIFLENVVLGQDVIELLDELEDNFINH